MDGDRRVLGDYALCTPAAIQSGITKLTSVQVMFRVKRKTKVLLNNKSMWWFVIHSEESVLSALDAEWEKVYLQTKWSLKRCYMPSRDASEVLSQVHINTASDATTSSSNALPCKSASGLSSPPRSQSIDLYVKSMFTCLVLFKGTTEFECIVVTMSCLVNPSPGSDVSVCLFYRPPGFAYSVLDTLFETLCNIFVSLASKFILICDFNRLLNSFWFLIS